MGRYVLLLLLIFSNLFASPRRVEVGAYLSDIYDINLFSQSFDAGFWIWFTYEGEDLDLENRTLVVNAPEAKLRYQKSERLPNGKMWTVMRWDSTFQQMIDFSTFPFINQNLQIFVEPIRYYTDELVFVPMNRDSGYGSGIDLVQWDLAGIHLSEYTRTYHSNFGNPSLPEEASFSRLEIGIELSRKNFRVFINHFGIYFLAFILSIAVFFVPMKELSSKMGLIVGAVFAAIGNNLFIDKEIPPVGSLTLIDKEQVLIVLVILATILTTLITRQFYRYEKIEMQKRIERIMAAILSIAFVIINLIILS